MSRNEDHILLTLVVRIQVEMTGIRTFLSDTMSKSVHFQGKKKFYHRCIIFYVIKESVHFPEISIALRCEQIRTHI